MGALRSVLLTKYYTGDQIMKNDMCVVCDTQGRPDRCIQGDVRDREKPLGIPRRKWKDNIKINLPVWDGGMDWTYLAQDRDRWWVLVNASMNLRVPENSAHLTN